MNVESFRLKDPLEWTVGEVGDFLASILQGDLATTVQPKTWLWLCYVDGNHLLDLWVTSMLQPCLVIYSWHWMLCCNCCNITHAKNHEKTDSWRWYDTTRLRYQGWQTVFVPWFSPQTVATKSWTAMPGLFPAHFWLCLGAQGSQGSMIPWLENRPWLVRWVSKSSVLNGA